MRAQARAAPGGEGASRAAPASAFGGDCSCNGRRGGGKGGDEAMRVGAARVAGMTVASELTGRCYTEERSECFRTQRRAWKALSRLRRSRRPLRRPHSARRGPRERPVAARGEPGVSAQWPARCLGQKSRSRPLGSAPERVRLGGEARGRAPRERLRNGRGPEGCCARATNRQNQG